MVIRARRNLPYCSCSSVRCSTGKGGKCRQHECNLLCCFHCNNYLTAILSEYLWKTWRLWLGIIGLYRFTVWRIIRIIWTEYGRRMQKHLILEKICFPSTSFFSVISKCFCYVNGRYRVAITQMNREKKYSISYIHFSSYVLIAPSVGDNTNWTVAQSI